MTCPPHRLMHIGRTTTDLGDVDIHACQVRGCAIIKASWAAGRVEDEAAAIESQCLCKTDFGGMAPIPCPRHPKAVR